MTLRNFLLPFLCDVALCRLAFGRGIVTLRVFRFFDLRVHVLALPLASRNLVLAGVHIVVLAHACLLGVANQRSCQHASLDSRLLEWPSQSPVPHCESRLANPESRIPSPDSDIDIIEVPPCN